MAIYAAVLDACVLVPVALCDTLLRLAEEQLFRPVWSERILDETSRAIVAVHPDIDPGVVVRRAQYMNEAFPGASVSGYGPIEAGLQLPDPDDRHVMAAALHSHADAIVTANVRDFPAAVLEQFELEAIAPDEFLLSQLDMRGAVVIEVLRAQANATKNPRRSLDDVLNSLVRAGVPAFVDEVRNRL